MLEVEVKAVVPDPADVRTRLLAAGAVTRFRGIMTDRRYDRDGALSTRDEVLRTRVTRPIGAETVWQIDWKGPVRRSDQGHKEREELTCRLHPGAGDPGSLLEALGYRVVQRIDRFVDTMDYRGTACRLEWYPRLDVLLEVEGAPDGIEAAIAATGIPRDAFGPDSLILFAARYTERTGTPAVLSLADLDGTPVPPWPTS